MTLSKSSRYSPLAQALHWLTAILVLIAFIFGPGGREEHVYDVSRDFERQLHETLGLCVFALTLVRVLWTLMDSTRPALPPMSRWMAITAKAVQGLLYVLLFAVPLTAIMGAWLEGHPLTLLGNAQIAPMLAKSHDLGAKIAEVHGWLGDVILWLAGLHAAAAIYHHFMLKDDVLRSMLPWGK